MYHFIYKTTNLINGKIYFGKHSTSNLDDGYLGSGDLIRRAIKKYGKENFFREIIVFCNDQDELSLLEEKYVDLQLVTHKESYNLALGGAGGCIVLKPGHPQRDETIDKIKEARRRPESRKVASENAKRNHITKTIGMYGRNQSNKQKDLASHFMANRTISEETKVKHRKSMQETFDNPDYVHPNKGRIVSEEHKLKLKPSLEKLHASYECIHCKRTIKGLSNYYRWHNDNCKFKGI